ncbi:hypothetical protein [Legionella sp. PC997]|uniref:hypothetical protein n=1 Tax=Legionella sp. PC997 TaxID=2755562 RepID=UPI0015FA2E06|nr:hypothetical protein [Legionella sp. PC997]QMT59748.1 hypothetical protein HBNCFIEN_01115 [Legionella sp. PC997]
MFMKNEQTKTKQKINDLYELKKLRLMEEQNEHLSFSQKRRIQKLEDQYPGYKAKRSREIDEQMLHDFPPNYSQHPLNWKPQKVVSQTEQAINDLHELCQLKRDAELHKPMEHLERARNKTRIENLENLYPKYKGKSSREIDEQLLHDFPPNYGRHPIKVISNREQKINDVNELRQLYAELYYPVVHRSLQEAKMNRMRELEFQYPTYKGKTPEQMDLQLLNEFPPDYRKAPPVPTNTQQVIRDLYELRRLKELLYGENGVIVVGKQYENMKARIAQLERMYPQCAHMNSNQLNNILIKLNSNNSYSSVPQETQATVHSEHIRQTRNDYIHQYKKTPQPIRGTTTGFHFDFPNNDERIRFLGEQAGKGREFIATDDNNKVMAYAKDGILYHGNHEEFKKGDKLQSWNISKEEFREEMENQQTGPKCR